MRIARLLRGTAALVLLAAAPAAAQSAAQGTAQGTGSARPPAAVPADTAADRQAVSAVVRGIFDAMRAGDSARIRAAFHPNAQLATSAMRQGAPVVQFDSVGAFVHAVGTPHEEVWDERLRSETVRLDAGLASVWTEYSFYAGQRFSHCGVNSFHLVRTAEGWKILSLVDTRRRQGCPDK
jgi:hypothetical protein